MQIKRDQAVTIVDAFGQEREARTLTGIEGVWEDGRKVHDFPVVWVTTDGENRLPWPLESVRPRPGGLTDES